MRADGRLAEQLRPTRIVPNYLIHAEGSVLVEAGKTKVICAASVEDRVPPFRRNTGKGWVTAEYGMLPRATTTRSQREATAGKVGGRTQEIQRLIGRSLRAVTRLEELGERTITLDCDVIQADGGTRTASITGAYVALVLAVARMREPFSVQIPALRPYGELLAFSTASAGVRNVSTESTGPKISSRAMRWADETPVKSVGANQ